MKLESEAKINEVVAYSLKKSRNEEVKYSISMNIIFDNHFTDKQLEQILYVKDNCKKLKLTLEIEEPILDEAERKYLSGVIRPFINEIGYIMKVNTQCGEYIKITFKNDECIVFPYFKKGSMYKGMELNKEYTLEELGL